MVASFSNFANFIADTLCILSWKWLTFGAEHIQDGWLLAIFVSLSLASSYRKYTLCDCNDSPGDW